MLFQLSRSKRGEECAGHSNDKGGSQCPRTHWAETRPGPGLMGLFRGDTVPAGGLPVPEENAGVSSRIRSEACLLLM